MTFEFETKTQKFIFGNSWTTVVSSSPPEQDPDLQRIRKGMGDVSTKDVDFIGLRWPFALHLIEVKDFRGRSGDLAEKTKSGTLTRHVAQKVRDSVPAIIGAHRTADKPDRWEPFAKALSQRADGLYVILWLEEDDFEGNMQAKVGRDTRQKDLKKRLSWLTDKVLVEGSHTRGQEELDIRTENIVTTQSAGRVSTSTKR